MNAPVLALGLLNLALVGALPRVFFRRGRLTVRWWLTALPFFASGAALLAAGAGLLAPALGPSAVREASAAALAAISIFLIGLTVGTHREPLSLWHQPDDAPRHLVTHGAYARVRHPFYAAFLLALLACALAFPHWSTAGAFLYACFQLDRTAAREEAALVSSPWGEEYVRYRERTGRFLPWPRRTRGEPA